VSRALVIAALVLAGLAAPASAQLNVNRRADLALPVVLGPGQGAIVVGFRRPDRLSAGKSAAVAFTRYDVDARDLILQPRHARRDGNTTTYNVLAKSGDRNLPLDHAVMVVSSGDYVLYGATPGPTKQVDNTFCLGTATFRVNPGEVVYFGDITPYMLVEMEDGRRANAMAYSSHPDDARQALAGRPELAAAFRPAEIRNGATYGCVAQAMLAYAVPGAPFLPPPVPGAAGTAGTPAGAPDPGNAPPDPDPEPDAALPQSGRSR